MLITAFPEVNLRTPRAPNAVLSHAERARALSLAQALCGERIAWVWASPLPAAHQAAQLVAGRLGVSIREDMAVDLVEALSEIADAHRGESVLIVIGNVGAQAIQLAGRDAARTEALVAALGNGSCVELAIDGDGWVIEVFESDKSGQ